MVYLSKSLKHKNHHTMTTQQESSPLAFFSVHSVKAMQNKAFSVVHGNIDKTPEKVELARSLYPAEDYHFDFHNHKIDLRPVFR